mgnify:CR=1 FL=1
MNQAFIIIILIAYFGVLLLISHYTSKNSTSQSFFTGDKKSPWYLVAFGMIGTSLSGVTFVSVPGTVTANGFYYYQMVLGFFIGYFIVAYVLLPLYYKYNLSSIYRYLEYRLGFAAYKWGAGYFILSRTLGATVRLYLVINVLQLFVFDSVGIPFWLSTVIIIAMIIAYTFRGGVKTIVWTDTLQTLFMLIAVGVAIYYISDGLGIGDDGVLNFIAQSDLSQIFFFDDYKSSNYFFKQFVSGMFIAIVMTGLDQDMMQKNLTCRNLKDAQKNMFWFTIVLTIVNLIFLGLGLLLTIYAEQNGIDAHKDTLFSTIAMNDNFGWGIGVFFLLGLIAAAYSSADSALTSLTTSFSIDILDIEKKHTPEDQIKVRKKVHIAMSLVLILVIVSFNYLIGDASVITKLFVFTGYTYGPLLGLYAFGLFSKQKIKDRFVPIIAILTPFVGYAISYFSSLWFGFEFGFFILILNGLLTYLGLVLIRTQQN